jgi:hypothetical protein
MAAGAQQEESSRWEANDFFFSGAIAGFPSDGFPSLSFLMVVRPFFDFFGYF